MIDLRNWGATSAEIMSPIAGDDLVGEGAEIGTRAIDIAADRDTVFGFLAQMGFRKAGWYSYDWLDNLGRTSATELHPDWMVETEGETVPAGPLHFDVVRIDRPHALALQVPRRQLLGYQMDFTLAYRLDESATGTRLISRVCVDIDGPGGRAMSHGLLLADGAMVRRQLIGIKQRCEAI